jgi:hypothetical protein
LNNDKKEARAIEKVFFLSSNIASDENQSCIFNVCTRRNKGQIARNDPQELTKNYRG